MQVLTSLSQWRYEIAQRRRVRRALRAAMLCAMLIRVVGSESAELVPACGPSADACEPTSEILASFDVERFGAPLVIPVDVETSGSGNQSHKATHRMLVDTGCSCTVFDMRFRAALGDVLGTKLAATQAGEIEVEEFKAPAIRIGSLSVRPHGNVLCFDLRRISTIFGRQIDGVLGMDVLRMAKFTIDCDAGRLCFLASVGPESGRAVSIFWDDHAAPAIPVVRGEVDYLGMESFRLDTGLVETFAGTLDASTYERLKNEGALMRLSRGQTNAADKVVETEFGALSTFDMRGYLHQKLIFARSAKSRISLGYLSRYKVTFDFPNSVMYLAPGGNFSCRDTIDLSGLVIRRGSDGSVEVVSILGRATLGGMREGDCITSIDGQNAGNMNLFAVRRILGTEGRHTCKVLRGTTELSLTLELAAEPREGNGQNRRGISVNKIEAVKGGKPGQN